ncbi:hypothetical protein G3574_00320 [Noviherbaspirillum sp. 17J57-3]|uniref:Uncharacterized protein n=1 Tax=Noviherbaspirillum galbum TaxID=2709383 RepID=A0A6B3SFY4_9BURK|nr:hypothetical protein [Noviherbaspirillum galbum]
MGTTGLGVDLSVPLQPNLNARFGANFLNYSYSGTANQVDYDFKLKLRTIDALLDWFPGAGSFHVSGGLYYNDNKVDATAKPGAGSRYTFNGQTYSASDVGSASGTIDFRKVAPYLGIGWGNALAKDKGWGFASDLGVLFQGSPTARLSAVCGPTALSVPGGCAQLQSNVAAEQASLNDKMNQLKYYPVARIALTYRF